ncbi:phage tail protein [Paraburkholderia tagetis]|uniref:Tail fiber protein n=1 Tax=Paraburkholderia tagetis TaxID=2913261 RepID=A0A9X1RQ28_9BURK|nr:tail fiber protein [Paraburkholderia tagetis]MCG5073233.1 tail fiber protein [Paraburkholderia tagetis]
MSDPFLGEIRMVGFNYAPNGWAFCQGQVLPIAQNTALFALLGTTYGGNGTTTFQLPDLRGRMPVGMGQGLGLSSIALGEQGGTENATLTTQNMPMHTHTATVSGGGAVTGQIAVPAATSTTGEGAMPGTSTVLGPISAGGRPGALYSTGTADTTLAPFNVTLQGAAPTIQNSLAGGSLPFALRNPYLGINFVIALQGIFPSRG